MQVVQYMYENYCILSYLILPSPRCQLTAAAPMLDFSPQDYRLILLVI